jgi:hypothetical protein
MIEREREKRERSVAERETLHLRGMGNRKVSCCENSQGVPRHPGKAMSERG